MEDYEKAKSMIEEIIKNIPESIKGKDLELVAYIYVKIGHMIDYDQHAADIIDAHLGGLDRERAYDMVVEPASDIRSLARSRALCKGYAEVLCYILNRLGIQTIEVSSGDHAWNQVLINGVWYNCDLTNDTEATRGEKDFRFFLVSDEEMKRKPKTETHTCETSLDDIKRSEVTKKTIKVVEREENMQTFSEIMDQLEGKISTDDLLVACKVEYDVHVSYTIYDHYEPTDMIEHLVRIDPIRTLIVKHKTLTKEMYLDTDTLEFIDPIEYSQSFDTEECHFGGRINDPYLEARLEKLEAKNMNRRGYFMTFREFIKIKLGIDVSEVTLRQASILLKLANIVRSKKFTLSKSSVTAKKQLDEKVYLKKPQKK